MMSFKVYKNVNQISSKSLVKGIKILLKKKKKKKNQKARLWLQTL